MDGLIIDKITRALHEATARKWETDFGQRHIQEAAERLCEANRFNPIVDYLDTLRWDGKSRIDTWLNVYCGAEDNALNRAIGRKFLCAMVRRARRPGCKWDHVLVLVSETGLKKSTLGRILACDDDDRARTGNFSDQTILPLRLEKRAELVKGKWVYELSELAGITKASVEELRSFISRQVDEGRPAYGRFVEQQPRTCVFYGTTNEFGLYLFPDERPAFLARRDESLGRRGAASRSGPANGRSGRGGSTRGEALSGG